MGVMRMMGVPYTDADIESASEVEGQNELQAVVNYLQVLGTMVKFDETKDYR
jgi:cytochrome c oxidase cbb3-type subunit 2